MSDERGHWNERYADEDREPPTEPADVLAKYVAGIPDGRALDVATGGGRNAIFLAEHGYAVDAIDISEAGLEIARERADERGVADRIEFVRADVEEHEFPREAYDAVVVARYYSLNVVPALKRALAPSGVLLYEHRLQPPGGSKRFRFRSNDLLRACLDLRIVSYEEPVEITGDDATVRLVARRGRA